MKGYIHKNATVVFFSSKFSIFHLSSVSVFNSAVMRSETKGGSGGISQGRPEGVLIFFFYYLVSLKRKVLR